MIVHPDARFHHVGVACADIRIEASRLAPLGYVIEGDEFVDAVLGVRGVFVGGQAPRLELLQPLDESPAGVLAPWLARDCKLYHLAYLVPVLGEAVECLRSDRAKLVVPPVGAVAFGGREVAFVMLPNRLLVELIASE